MSLLKHCADGNLLQIKSLLSRVKSRRNKVQVRDNHNWTCLHHAVKNGSVECIKFLLTIPELDTTVETFEGETALHIACSIPNISLEIISVLLEANVDLINFVNNEEVDLLQCAIVQKRLDIVKLLVGKGAPVNKQDLDGDTALHIAANESQLDIIRYLLYATDCDPTIRNEKERTACFLLFLKLLPKLMRDPQLMVEEMNCFMDLVEFTFNLDYPHTTNGDEDELNHMIYIGYHFNEPRNCLYMGIMKLLQVPPSKQYFFRKILASNVPSCHCLIIALLENNPDLRQSVDLGTCWPNFFCELFSLFVADESFFNEYIPEIMSGGWKYSELIQATKFCEFITENRDSVQPQKLFSFLKVLILYEIDFDVFMRCCEELLLPVIMLNVFAPLVKFVIPSFPLKENCNYLSYNYNFNESNDLMNDLRRSLDLKQVKEVVSLKNLSRMSVRKYYFETCSHYVATKALYNLNIPIKVRNFLCYNSCNFEF